jgi:hypothetical protein
MEAFAFTNGSPHDRKKDRNRWITRIQLFENDSRESKNIFRFYGFNELFLAPV